MGAAPVPVPVPDEPIRLSDILQSRLWRSLQNFALYEFQTTMFQPVGGMDRIGQAFAARLPGLIRYGARVTQIVQDGRHVTVAYEQDGAMRQANAEWCVCTLPLTVLSQLPLQVGAAMKAAIDAVPYASSFKVGLQVRRRFWEEDEAIYGGISDTDLPIRQISYPSTDYNLGGKGVLLGGDTWNGPNSYEWTALSPEERVRLAVEFGARIHPQYRDEFETGISVAWHRVPFTLGCAGDWTEAAPHGHDDLARLPRCLWRRFRRRRCTAPSWMRCALWGSAWP